MLVYTIINTILQLAMVTAGHYNETILALSAPLGVGIPLVVAIVYGLGAGKSGGGAAKTAFAFSFVGAFIGVVGAIALGDAELVLLTFAPLSSGVTGALGGFVGAKLGGGKTAGATA